MQDPGSEQLNTPTSENTDNELQMTLKTKREKKPSHRKLQKKENDKQRQAMGKYYRVNGAVYFVRVAAFFENMHLYRNGSVAYVMPQDRSTDIDTELDFKIAEVILKDQKMK